jgi:hypothetical protein
LVGQKLSMYTSKLFWRRTTSVAITVVSCSAALTASAQAASFHAEKATEASPAVLAGGQTVPHEFTVDATELTCTTASFPGKATNVLESTIRVQPSYSGCTAFGFVGANIEMNGCEYEFKSPTGSGGTYTGNVGVVCPAGEEITVTESGTCTIHVPASSHNSNLGAATYKNEGTGTARKILVTANFKEGIEYSQSGVFCSSETGKTNGSYTGSTLERATNGGKADGIWVE